MRYKDYFQSSHNCELESVLFKSIGWKGQNDDFMNPNVDVMCYGVS